MAELSGAPLPYQAEWSICDAARHAGAEQVMMFGSRARCDTDLLSEIDLAVRGGDARLFTALLHEQSSVPWMFDVVRLDGSESPAIAGSIRLASQHGILQNVQLWFSMLDRRNEAVHLCDAQNAGDLIVIIKERYVKAFGELLSLLEDMMQDVSSDTQIH